MSWRVYRNMAVKYGLVWIDRNFGLRLVKVLGLKLWSGLVLWDRIRVRSKAGARPDFSSAASSAAHSAARGAVPRDTLLDWTFRRPISVLLADPRAARNRSFFYYPADIVLKLAIIRIRIWQPVHLWKLLTLQPSRSTQSPSHLTLSHPLNQSSLKICNRSFLYTVLHLSSSTLNSCLPSELTTLSNYRFWLLTLH